MAGASQPRWNGCAGDVARVDVLVWLPDNRAQQLFPFDPATYGNCCATPST